MKALTQKITAAAAALTMIFSAAAFGTLNASAAVDASNVSGSFTYRATDNANGTAKFFYSDNYFKTSSAVYSPNLSTMSLCLELAAWPSHNASYENQTENLKNLFEQTGFSDMALNNDYTCAPTADSFGVAAAQKKLDDNCTLVAVALRGGYYTNEWAGNVTMGKSGNHTGFDSAKNKTVAFVNDYIASHTSGSVKLWIVGYSRAGAVANLTGKWFDDNQASTGISSNDIYAYTFEAPQAALASEVKDNDAYSNIHNVVNPADPVTKIGCSQWGFARAGVDYVLPADTSAADYAVKRDNMLKFRNTLTTDSDYKVDAVAKYLGEQQGDFLDRYLGYVANGISREYYAEHIQASAREAMLSSSASGYASFIYSLGGQAAKIISSHPVDTYSLISSAKDIVSVHYPENCLAWLMSFDSNYTA